MNAPRWEHFEHEADIGVRGMGATPGEAFEMAAVALSAVVADPVRIECRDEVALEARADTLEQLLVAWLSAVIFEMASRRMLFRRFHVTLENTNLRATAAGEPVDPARHEPAVEVKGASYAC